ncbi:polycomb protein Pcl-like [Bolinopsis microptera]|uniref:polycomb protein Pcl-like n=1 Tax=Bolinopsis microptera TaxID=2820187 RepID=UPI003078FD8C
MSINRTLDVIMDKNTGLWWQLQAHNTPPLFSGHLDEVTKRSTDISPNVLDKIRSELKLKTLTSLNLYYDFLPYKTAELTWDAKHRYNEEGVYCYCMGPGVWYKQMLQCLNCRQWFHQACVSCSAKPMLFGENNIFICSVCNLGEEHLTLRALSDRECLQLAMYHVVMTRYRGDFQLPVCLRMNTTPLLQAWDPVRFQDLQVWTLAQTAIDNPDLFQPGAKHKNTTLYRYRMVKGAEKLSKLLVDEPPSFPLDETLTLPLPASHQPIPHYLPPGFVMDLANGTSGKIPQIHSI